MRKDDLTKLCQSFITKWRPILRVSDWNIELSVCADDQTMKTTGMAEMGINSDLKRGRLCINFEQHRGKSLRELEASVVHELLHVATDAWVLLIEKTIEDPTHRSTQMTLLEQAVESLSRGLVEALGEPDRELRL